MMRKKDGHMRNYFWALVFASQFLLPLITNGQNSVSDSGSFVTMTGKDEAYSTYMLSMVQVPGFLERAFLVDLIFNDRNIIVMKTRVSDEGMEVKASSDLDPDSVIRTLEQYKEDAIEYCCKLSGHVKEELITKYAKYR